MNWIEPFRHGAIQVLEKRPHDSHFICIGIDAALARMDLVVCLEHQAEHVATQSRTYFSRFFSTMSMAIGQQSQPGSARQGRRLYDASYHLKGTDRAIPFVRIAAGSAIIFF
jgi:hypothetical protein